MRRSCHVVALLLAIVTFASAQPSAAQVVVVRIVRPPPPLPIYVQPAIPGPDYYWTPGYWAWGPDDYYWVPGTWVLAPSPGLLWTPGYWAWRDDGVYVWRSGYWGPRVGFYGGVNYGYGYAGAGYYGGYWSGRVFTYNTAVTNVGSVHITNVYNKTVINNTTVNNVSFNGGTGGLAAKPTADEAAAAKDKHIAPTALQTQHEHAASTNHALLASVNNGKPSIAATAKAGQFSGQGIIAAKGVHPAKSWDAAKMGPKPPGQFNAAKVAGTPGVRPPQHKPPQYKPKKPEHDGPQNK